MCESLMRIGSLDFVEWGYHFRLIVGIHIYRDQNIGTSSRHKLCPQFCARDELMWHIID